MPPKHTSQGDITDRWNSLITKAHGFNQIGSEQITMRVLDQPRQYLAKQLPALIDMIKARNALEIAGGAASNQTHFGPVLAENRVRLTFTDVVDAAFAEAGEVMQRADLSYSLEVQDAQRLDYPEASYDIVFCSFAMCTFPDLPKALSEVYRVLRPGGLLVCIEHVLSDNPLLAMFQNLTPKLGDSQSPGCEWNRRIPDMIHTGTGFNFLDIHVFQPAGIILAMVAQKPLDHDPDLRHES